MERLPSSPLVHKEKLNTIQQNVERMDCNESYLQWFGVYPRPKAGP